MGEQDREATVARRPWFKCFLQRELAVIATCSSNAELGRYYRARIIAEAAGRITPEAEKAAGKGQAAGLLAGCQETIEAGAAEYLKAVEDGKRGSRKRWGS